MTEPLTSVPSALEDLVADRFRAWILDPTFSCVGAKSAVQRGRCAVRVYGEMGSADASNRLAHDLATFVDRQDPEESAFSSFAAAFTSPLAPDERTFELLLWRQLQSLHELDGSPWDAGVSSDPRHATFAFSFAGRAFFVVGLHPQSSRLARRFAWPALVFNARFQFERLRERGHYHRMQAVIRARDRMLQGSENPMLGDFGRRSEARQYSGRAVDDTWTCPFQPTPSTSAR